MTIISGIANAITGKRSADKAADAQRYANDAALSEQARQFDRGVELNEQSIQEQQKRYNEALNFVDSGIARQAPLQGQLDKYSDLSENEQRQQFNAFNQSMQPYVDVGQDALFGQERLLGLQGDASQAEAMQELMDTPLYQGLMEQGEDAILQNASATGGLRGGRTQGALANFRPNLLNQLLQQQFNNLGGLNDVGRSAAVQQGAAGQGLASGISQLNTNRILQGQNLANALTNLDTSKASLATGLGSNLSNLYGQQAALGTNFGNTFAAGARNDGAITAQNRLAQGAGNQQMIGEVSNFVGSLASAGAFGGGGGFGLGGGGSVNSAPTSSGVGFGSFGTSGFGF